MVAGTRASSVDGELPWRSSGGQQLWCPLLDRGRKRRRKTGFLVCATKPRRRTAVKDAKSWRHGCRSQDCRRRRALTASRASLLGRGGDGRRAASRAVRRPRREWRLGPRHGGGNLPAREVLAVFSKLAIYPGFADLPKPQNGSSSRRRHCGEDFVSKKEPRPSDGIVYRGCCRPTGLTGPWHRSDRSLAPV